MNGIWFRALLVSLFTVSPIAVASAQETPPAEEQVEETDEKKAEPKADEDKKTEEEKTSDEEEAKAEEADADSDAEEGKADEAKSDEPKPADEAPAAQPEAAKDTPVETPPEAPAVETKPTDQTPADSPVLMSAETTPETAAGKPWKVSAKLGASLGAGFLVSNPDLRRPSFGWVFDASGSYTITPLLDGNLNAFLRITMDQVLANALSESAVGQTKQYEFFFRDIRLGVTAPGLYKETLTGITASLSTEIFLPTSKTTIAAKRWLRWGLNGRLSRNFEKLGPGDLNLSLGTVFRKDFSARQVNLDDTSLAYDVCRVTNIKDGDCIGSQRNSNFSFINDLGISYTWGPVTAGVSFAVYSIRYFAQDLGPDPAGVEVRESSFTTDNTWSNLTLASFGAAYQITEMFSLSLDVTTYQNPYVGPNSKLRFPFFDTSSTADNLTTFDLTAAFVY